MNVNEVNERIARCRDCAKLAVFLAFRTLPSHLIGHGRRRE